MKTNPEIDALERQLNTLRIEFERYFNGALDLPPTELQHQLTIRLRDLRNHTTGSIDNFRLNSLEAKFNSYNEMFNRRVRDIEEGRIKVRRSEDVPAPVNVQEGVMVADRVDTTAAAALFQGLYADSSKASKVDMDKFRGYLNQQASKIRKKTGCTQVQFRLANEGGQMKLKAKPVKSQAG